MLILLLGALIEAVLLLGLVRPLWLLHHHDAIPTPEPLATVLGIDRGGPLRFAGTITVWLAGYVAVCVLARGPLSAGARRALVALPWLFAATLLFVLPVSSQDVYHYVMEGRILAVYGDNPMTVPPQAYPDDRFAWTIQTWGDTPSRYGPVFNLVAAGVTRAGGNSLTANLIGFKLAATAALLGTAALAWLTMRRIRPELALPAYVLVAWNPLALYEAGANAHNDLLMVFFTALALYLAARRRWELALPALALGVLTKFVVVLLAPLMLMASATPNLTGGGGSAECDRRRQRLAFRLPRSAWVGVAVSAALTVALYAPYWNGVHTFDALRSASGEMLNSPGWLLRQVLKHPLGWEGARLPVELILTSVFLSGYALTLRRVRRRMRTGADDSAFVVHRASFIVLALVLATLSWWLWPWYALWLLPAAVLLVDRQAALIMMVATGAALFAYLPINFRELFWGTVPTDRMSLAAVIVLFIPPLGAALIMRVRRGAGVAAATASQGRRPVRGRPGG